MSSEKKDARIGDIRRPPSRLGRLLIALRYSIHTRRANREASAKFQEVASKLPSGTSRVAAALLVQDVTEVSITQDYIRRLENGGGRKPSLEKLEALLESYGLSAEEVERVLTDPNLNAEPGANPHLILPWRLRTLAVGEFGNMVLDALPMGEYLTTWVESEKSADGGFRLGEVTIRSNESIVEPPARFAKLADDAKAQNEERKAAGIRGWSDNPTFCLESVVSEMSPDAEERNFITLTMQRSWYRYNVIAKQEGGAEYRWKALQDAKHPIKPVPFLASGVGICINVICDGGKSIVLGQRSDHETFRKNEFDVAVVEGIRPEGDIEGGTIDIMTVARRALSEEMGLDTKTLGIDFDAVLKRLVVFEFGCDLEFYQWNFLGFAEVDLDFDTIYRSWQKAKDRKENQTIKSHPFDKKELMKTFELFPIWSSGIACALRTFDFY